MNGGDRDLMAVGLDSDETARGEGAAVALPVVERWQRFTLVDLLLLFVPVALGFTWAKLRFEDSIVMIFSGMFVGGLLIAPVIVASHYLRGRRADPSFGEWAPGAALLVPMILTSISPLEEQPFFVVVFFVYGIIAQVRLWRHFFGGKPWNLPCVWTDSVGCAALSLTGWGLPILASL